MKTVAELNKELAKVKENKMGLSRHVKNVELARIRGEMVKAMQELARRSREGREKEHEDAKAVLSGETSHR